MSDKELSGGEQRKDGFPPESDEYKEVHFGPTPLGGDVSIAYFFDKNGNHCKREDMAYMNIVIYTKDGKYVNSVSGKR